ncbi:MAG: hypothetical protein ACODAG_06125 [Myxococcota bacterium]
MQAQTNSSTLPPAVADLLDGLPDHLREYVEAGHPARWDPDDPLPGRCGGARWDGEPCRRGAGWGTDHTGVGRCKNHPDLHTGLSPWIGVLPRQEWAAIVGRQVVRDDKGRFAATHGQDGKIKAVKATFRDLLPTDGSRRAYDELPVEVQEQVRKKLQELEGANYVRLEHYSERIDELRLELARLDGKIDGMPEDHEDRPELIKDRDTVARSLERYKEKFAAAKNDEAVIAFRGIEKLQKDAELRQGQAREDRIADVFRQLDWQDLATAGRDPLWVFRMMGED